MIETLEKTFTKWLCTVKRFFAMSGKSRSAICITNPTLDFYLFVRDTIQTYKSAETELSQNVSICQSLDLENSAGFPLWILCLLYGLAGRKGHWYETHHKYYIDRMKILSYIQDSCILCSTTAALETAKHFDRISKWSYLQTDDLLKDRKIAFTNLTCWPAICFVPKFMRLSHWSNQNHLKKFLLLPHM